MSNSSVRAGGLALLVLCACGGAVEDTKPQPKWSSLYSTYLKNCASCHAPGAPGRTSDIESSLDFSTAGKGFQTVSGNAAGLSGNQAACNGVKFVVAGQPAQSLLLAVLDSPTRTSFVSGSCDQDGVTDEGVKQGTPASAEFIAALKQWITSGASDN